MIKNAEEKRLKEEELDNDKRMAIQDSKHQLDNNKHLDDKRLLHFENAKKEMEMESKERVASLQSQLTDSYKKMQVSIKQVEGHLKGKGRQMAKKPL
jgi:hypothetical protein